MYCLLSRRYCQITVIYLRRRAAKPIQCAYCRCPILLSYLILLPLRKERIFVLNFQRVDKKAKTKWRFSRIMGLIFVVIPVAALIVLISSAVAEETWQPAENLGIGIASALVVIQLLQIILYPPIEYAQWQYMIAPDRIEIRKGIFYRVHTVIPISRIQHVAVTQGVLQRPFGLSTVQLHTAGDVMEIQELSTDMAEKICSYLQKRVNFKLGGGHASAQGRAEG